LHLLKISSIEIRPGKTQAYEYNENKKQSHHTGFFSFAFNPKAFLQNNVNDIHTKSFNEKLFVRVRKYESVNRYELPD